MIATTNLKVAFQGGGAKVMPLLAVAEAVHDLCDSREIAVTGLSGTSAGAIVASVLANGVDVRQFALHLCGNGPDYIKRILGARSIGNDTLRERIRIAIKIVSSNPIGNIGQLENILREVFVRCDANFGSSRTIGESKIPLKIVVSDLLKADKVVICSNTHSKNDLCRTIVDSCALPIFFRTKRSLEGSPYIDGGLFDNFPTEVLIDEFDNDPVIGITFEKPVATTSVNTVVSYLARLLFSSIDHSVKRSARLLNETDIHRVSTDLDTLDFNRAMSQGPGTDTYERVKSDAVNWLRRYVEKVNSTDGRRSLDDLLRDNHKIYESQHSETPRNIKRSSLIATLSVLAPRGNPRYSKYSEFRNELVFEPTSQPIYALTVTSGTRLDDDRLANWKIDARDADMRMLDTTVIPGIADVPTPSGESQPTLMSIVHFSSPLSANSKTPAPYTLSSTQYVADGLLDLETQRRDVVGIGNSTEFVHRESTIVLFVPEEFPEISATPEHPRKVVPLSDKELALHGRCPGGFRAQGWKTQNLGKGEFFSLSLTI